MAAAKIVIFANEMIISVMVKPSMLLLSSSCSCVCSFTDRKQSIAEKLTSLDFFSNLVFGGRKVRLNKKMRDRGLPMSLFSIRFHQKCF